MFHVKHPPFLRVGFAVSRETFFLKFFLILQIFY